ncbi:MAG TPA: TlpA disulfide reductase family protein [Nitrospinota bacterium]|nr:TlpA disulfide reductase family protein [Nitrospinota bacterium]
MINRKVIIVLVFLVIAIFFLQWLKKERFKPPIPGNPAPEFSFKNLEGQVVDLKDFREKVVLLNIWATWCKPCRDELPSMELLYRKLKDRGFEILAVSIDKDSSIVKPFVEELGLTFPVLLDPKGKITRLYRTIGIPENYIIDKRGIIKEKIIGARDWLSKTYVDSLSQLLEEEKEKESFFQKLKIESLKIKRAPDFTLKDINKKEVSLKDFRGKVVLLNFWATWCDPCTDEMPSMEGLYQRFQNKGFVVLAVNYLERREKVRKFVEKNKFTFTVLLDPYGKTLSSYGIWSIPVNFIIDKQGFLLGRAIGPRDWYSKETRELIDYLLRN